MPEPYPELSRKTTASTNLTIVCCHAIYLHPELGDPCNEMHWHLQPFQRSTSSKPGEHETFLQHIRAGVGTLLKDPALSHPQDILIFSGGATAPHVTSTSEAESYFNAALALYSPEQRKQLGQGLGRSILLEKHATDSYQNLLFSLLLFRKATGTYPTSITVITHAFKAERFLGLHVKAIRWPSDRVRVLGINPVMSREEMEETLEGEKIRGYGAFERDLYGVGAALGQKRRQRGWDDAVMESLCEGLEESVQDLVKWKGGENGKEVFPRRLPWEEG